MVFRHLLLYMHEDIKVIAAHTVRFLCKSKRRTDDQEGGSIEDPEAIFRVLTMDTMED